MHVCVVACVDNMSRRFQDYDVILTGDFNPLGESFAYPLYMGIHKWLTGRLAREQL